MRQSRGTVGPDGARTAADDERRPRACAEDGGCSGMWGKRGAGAVVALVVALALTACQAGSSDSATKAASTTSSAAAPTTSAAPTSPAGAPVHVTTFEGD